MTTETESEEAPQSFADYKAARLAPPEATPEPEATQGKAEPAEKVEEPVEAPPAKKANKLESRFSELTAAKRAAEEKAAAAEARAVAAEAKAALPAGKAETPSAPEEQAEADQIGPKPKQAEYTDPFKYAEDLAEWSANKALKDRDAADAKKAEETERAKVIDAWKVRVEAVKVERPDWAEMVESSKAAVSDPARDALIESPFGPQIVHDLAADDDLATKVSAMKPAEQLRWIGRQEGKYESASEQKEKAPPPVPPIRPKAPAPITAVRGGRVDSLDDSGEFTGTYQEYKAKRLAQIR